MIKRLKYHEIDFEKYENCIGNSQQKNFYAQKKILDFLCKDWEVLISGDYEAVMPIPLKRKLGFAIVVMPLFCQQLGIFSRKDDKILNLDFLIFLKKNYRILNYAFNHQNNFPEKLTSKKNYIINKTEYHLLRKKYFKGRKSTVKTAQFHECKELQYDNWVKNYVQNNYKGLNRDADANKFFDFLNFLHKENLLKVFGSFNKENSTSIVLIIEEQERLSLLGLINDGRFRNDNGASFLIDYLLKNNIHLKNFNFMGGNIRGIEVFFKSFGSDLQQFPAIQYSKKEVLLSFFPKFK